jgi:hypothetical protein
MDAPLQNEVERKLKSGGTPPFLTCQIKTFERWSLKRQCLTGREEGLAPALSNLQPAYCKTVSFTCELILPER